MYAKPIAAAALTLAGFAAACGGGDPAPPSGQAAAAPAATPAAASTDPRAQIFITKGCPQCHAISAFGVTSLTNVGPDLSIAVDDVRSRFNTTLEEFLENPTGTMQIVLSAQIRLTEAERDSIVRLLSSITPNP